MSAKESARALRFDRALRVVMWLDAFLSIAMVVVCLIASPVVAMAGVPRGSRAALAVAAIGCAVLLAAFGAITAVLLMLRMRGGQFLLPVGLRLPLPAPMRPPVVPAAAAASRRRSASAETVGSTAR